MANDDKHEMEQLAERAIKIYKEIQTLTSQLDTFKEQLRLHADGKTTTIDIIGAGSITVSKPKSESTKTVLSISEDTLNKNIELRNKLIQKGIILETTKTTPPSAASVTFKLNK